MVSIKYISFAILINHKKRYQKGLKTEHLFPSIEGACACGCGQQLTGRQKRWASPDCNNIAYVSTAIIKGDNKLIRQLLFKRDLGVCKSCNKYSENWEADHINPISKGGGACSIENFQTLCKQCHNFKTLYQTYKVSQRAIISSHEAVSECKDFLYEAGAEL